MKIELHAEKYVIRRGKDYFQCFTADAVFWIRTPYLAQHFVVKENAEGALAHIREESASQVRRRRKAKA